ncbi:MAG TPA: hypothetical protein VML50_09020 [Anaeromyxobacter sp.]|nr:hypothetical protein [Anaeromyxobacter sp.]
MRPNLPRKPADRPRARDAALPSEGLRLAGACAALLAAVLLVAGGLLWREDARARHLPGAGVARVLR